jgi:uncharacterized protein (DUF927 family)
MLDANNIPDELKQRKQWVCWRFVEKRNETAGQIRKIKVPFQVNGKPAKSSDTATWISFDVAVAASSKFNGIGFMFAADDPFCGVDLDDCLNADGTVKDWAMPILSTLAHTYMEVSPSGTGIKVFARGKLTGSGKKTSMKDAKDASDSEDAIELYDQGRYFTVTGQRWNGAPIAVTDQQPVIDQIVAMIDERSGRKRQAFAKQRGRASEVVEGEREWFGVNRWDYGADDDGMMGPSANVDDCLSRVAWHMVYHHHERDAVRAHLARLNEKYCGSDRDDADLDRLTDSAMKNPDRAEHIPLFADAATGNKYFKARKGNHWQIFRRVGKKYEPICGLIDRVSKVVGADNTGRARLVQWKDEHGKPSETLVDLDDLVTTRGGGGEAIKKLINAGLYIYPNGGMHTAAMIALFPSEAEDRVFMAHKPGWTMLPDDSIAYVMPGASYGVEGVRLDIGQHFYRVKGMLEEWRREIGQRCVGNTRLTLAVAAAFAGPLLRDLSMAGIGLHFTGPTSLGKSTVLRAAGSVLGGGNGTNGYMRAWNATANSLEVIAEGTNDSALVLDELGGGKAKEMMQSVYALLNGIGRTRLGKDSELRRARDWRLVLISAGELDPHEFAKTADIETKGGIDVRLIGVPMPVGAHGMFEKLHGAAGGREFSESLKHNALVHYGTAFREFLAKLSQDLQQHIEHARAGARDFEQAQGTMSPEVGRVCKAFAVVAAAGELASQFGVTGWPQGWAAEAASVCFKAWRDDRGEAETVSSGIDAKRGIDHLVEQFHRRRRSFRCLNGLAPDLAPHDLLGYYDNDYVYIRTATLTDTLLKGFSVKTVLAELDARGMLLRTDQQRKTTRITVKGEAKQVAVYGISQEVFGGVDLASDF